MNKNQNLIERSQKAVWHPCSQMKKYENYPLIPIKKGSGIWLEDFEGKTYLDAISSWWVNLFGHSNPKINQALKDQIDQLEHVILAGFTHEPVVELSERLSQATSNGVLGHCFYGSDGSSAVEISLKMAFHYFHNLGQIRKKNYLCLKNGYHGESIGALAVTDVDIFSKTYAPLIQEAVKVTSPSNYHLFPEHSAESYALECAKEVELYLEEHHEEICAFILEPLVQGATGMTMYHPIYLKRIRELCDQFNILMIADEIAMGFGRTGKMFACQHADIIPDLLCLSKGITGGYLPLSVVLSRDFIYNAFYDDNVTRGFLHSHSYTGNTLACRVALTVLDIFEKDNIIAENSLKTERFNQIIKKLTQRHDVQNFRNLGMIWAFDTPYQAQALHHAGLQENILIRPIGNTTYFMPPYIITDDNFSFLVDKTMKSLDYVGKSSHHDTIDFKFA